jgi:hypothetical protein
VTRLVRRVWIALAIGALAGACGGGLPGGELPPSPSRSPQAVLEASPPVVVASLPAGSVAPAAFAAAWAALVEAHDTAAVDLLIANPLAEYDLVGNRLTDLVRGTRDRVAAIEPPAALTTEVRAVETSMSAILDRLERIDPHGPRAEQATAFQDALDAWIADLEPHAAAIRDALGLPPVPPGDLQL